MSELKPVAYLHVTNKNKKERYLEFGISDNENFTSVPLYTKEQLQPRVEMTVKELEEFNQFFVYRKDTTINNMLSFIKINRDNDTKNLYKRFFETGTLESSIEAQLDFANLWATYNPDNPEETVEIFSEKKWFVRVDSKIPLPDENIYLDDELIVYPRYDSPKSSAHQFDTRAEAKKWTNPLTETVLLPVDE